MKVEQLSEELKEEFMEKNCEGMLEVKEKMKREVEVASAVEIKEEYIEESKDPRRLKGKAWLKILKMKL